MSDQRTVTRAGTIGDDELVTTTSANDPLQTAARPPALERSVRLSDVDPALRRSALTLPPAFGLAGALAPQRSMMRLFGKASKLRDVPVVTVSSDVSVRLHRPERLNQPEPALLWIHGGGYVMGTAAQDDVLCRRLAYDVGMTVAAVDYRLAPEHPYPAAVEDCHAALCWLATQPWVDPARIAIGGASGGGGLAAALAFLARDRREVSPALQLLVYPMIDDRVGRGPSRAARRYAWSARDNQRAWKWYLGDADRDLAVPARRRDLAGLAPTWLGSCALDLFYAENVEYGDRLRAAGVACHSEIVEGAYHGFDMAAPKSTVAMAFHAAKCRALRAALHAVE